MEGPHATPETIRRFLRSELPAEEAAGVVRHLLARCPECLGVAGQAAWVDRLPPLPALGRPLARHAYEQALEATERSAALREQALERERRVADAQWCELRRQPVRRQLWWIRNDPRFGTWAFCEQLLKDGWTQAGRDPSRAVELAGLAMDSVRHLEVSRYGARPLADLEATAWSTLAEARRLDLDLDGAAEALGCARHALESGTGGALERARLRRQELALADDHGDLERVQEGLDQVLRVARRTGDCSLEAHARLLEAKAAGQLDPERGIALLGSALDALEQKDLWLELSARHHLIWFLNDAGRVRQAALLLAASRSLYRPFGCLRARLERRWLEGRIARRLGCPAEAERAFEEIWPALSERRLQFKLTCLSLDLAEVYVERGKRQHVLPLVGGSLVGVRG